MEPRRVQPQVKDKRERRKKKKSSSVHRSVGKGNDQDHESCHSAKSTVLWSRPIPVMLWPVTRDMPPIPRPSVSRPTRKSFDLSMPPFFRAGYQGPKPTRVPTLETARAYNIRSLASQVDRPNFTARFEWLQLKFLKRKLRSPD